MTTLFASMEQQSFFLNKITLIVLNSLLNYIYKRRFCIIYPSLYCSKYRPYRVVQYKPADRIFRITTV